MKKIISILLVFTFLLIPLGLANEVEEGISRDVAEELEQKIQQKYANNQIGENESLCIYASTRFATVGQEVPEGIPYRNDVFNVHVGDEEVFHISIEDGIVTSLNCDELHEEHTYSVYITNKDVVSTILESDKYIEAYLDAKKTNDIRIVGNSFGKKFKQGFVNLGLRIANLFS